MSKTKRMIVTLTYEAEYDDEIEMYYIHDKLQAGSEVKTTLPLMVYDYDDDDKAILYYLKLKQVQTSIGPDTMITQTEK